MCRFRKLVPVAAISHYDPLWYHTLSPAFVCYIRVDISSVYHSIISNFTIPSWPISAARESRVLPSSSIMLGLTSLQPSGNLTSSPRPPRVIRGRALLACRFATLGLASYR
ncbi:unnamed protein product [Tuber melanosporum]|uniref:(Perigord truffle) hypothetical protein n=1 Tax=Tuber melanosporum (strain Mel28) TaxID=656061 RepID=D5GKQ2_TUBMM|nr:uncharacterized protein GSTUM_00009699001 [Tuber melanosporum]CAZ85095.1 unnamed protein product [Tuber melanosporum]